MTKPKTGAHMTATATVTVDFPKGCKPSKVCSTDKTRPVLLSPFLRKVKDSYELHATNSYTALRVPVRVVGEPADGQIPVDAMKLAESQKRPSLGAENGTVEIEDGRVVFRRDETAGPFPDLVQLWPADEPKQPLVIGLNTKLLRQLAEAMGVDTVKFVLDMGNVPEGSSAYLRPYRIRPLGGPVPDAEGLLMPVRVDVS